MDIRSTRTCERCNSVTPLDKVRLIAKDKDTSMLLCEPCAGKYNRRVELVTAKTSIEPLPPAEYAKYKCTRCNYAFRVDTIKAGLTHRLLCPYCGKSERLIKAKK